MAPFVHRACAAVSVSLVLASCGSTATLRQAHEIAVAGKAYSDAMQTIADVAIDSTIADTSAGLVRSRNAAWGRFPDSDRLVADLRTQRDKAAPLVMEIAIFKAHSARLEEYFDALGLLVAEPAKAGFVAATAELAASAAALGTVLESKNIVTSAHVTPPQQSALGSLGGAIGEWYQAKTVREVLTRDAATIDRQLVIQQKALAYIALVIAQGQERENAEFFRLKVSEPYVQGYPAPSTTPRPKAPALPAGWFTDFSTDLKTGLAVQQAEQARKAAEKLRQAWKDFSEGRWTTGDLVGDLTKVRDGLEQVKKIHENRHAAAN